MISKELLSEVLDVEVRVIAGVTSTNELKYNNDSIAQFINIYELAHKCNEYLGNHADFLVYDDVVYIDPDLGEGGFYYSRTFDSGSEVSSIFSACQWILDNKTN